MANITADQLAQKLANAKKVMNKVETGNYEKGNINESLLSENTDDFIPGNGEYNEPVRSNPTRPIGNPTVDRINESKLPDNIKQAMINNPIVVPNISLTDSLDMDFVKKAKSLMELDGTLPQKTVSNKSPQKLVERHDKFEKQEYGSSINVNEIINALSPLIENTIRKIMDEKLTQILTAQQTGSINENLVLRVGDSIFKGKITGVKNVK